MAEYLNEAVLPVDVDKLVDKDMSCRWLMTEDFFQFNAAYAVELCPKTKVTGVLKSFGRNTPMLKPILGSARSITRKFFVPFRVVWPAYNDFYEQAPHNTPDGTQIIAENPILAMPYLIQAFVTGAPGFDPMVVEITDSSSISAGAFDFSYDAKYYNFNYQGRQAVKILNQLGYQFLPQAKNEDPIRVSALPLLCMAKIYVDWYWPTQYAQVGSAAVINGLFQRHFTYTLSILELCHILSTITHTFYENDLFTSAWDNPVSPSVGAYTGLKIPDITNNGNLSGVSTSAVVANDPSLVGSPGNSAYKPSNGTPFVGGSYGTSSTGYTFSTGVFTQYTDVALHVLTDIMHKYAIVGSRALERYLAEWGIKLNSEQLQRSVYLGESVVPWQIGAVFSQSDTYDSATDSGAVLGQYAGSGAVAEKGFSLDYDNQTEFGYYIVIHSLLPDIGYVQGMDKFVMHTTPFDYYHGKVANLGTGALSVLELMHSKFSTNGFNLAAKNRVFGWTRLYYEYCVARDRMCGDFCLDSINQGMLPWSTTRMFEDSSSLNASNFGHSLDFMRSKDRVQYDRVFYGYDAVVPSNNQDNFQFAHYMSIKFASPTKSFYDNYCWLDEDNPKIRIKGNGVRMS